MAGGRFFPMPSHLTSRFAAITIGLAMAVGAMIGLVLAGNLTPSPAHSAPTERRVTATPTMTPIVVRTARSFAWRRLRRAKCNMSK